ncbi:MAG: hypothetical protein R3E39_08050 [Anaerolineae bacterium]
MDGRPDGGGVDAFATAFAAVAAAPRWVDAVLLERLQLADIQGSGVVGTGGDGFDEFTQVGEHVLESDAAVLVVQRLEEAVNVDHFESSGVEVVGCTKGLPEFLGAGVLVDGGGFAASAAQDGEVSLRDFMRRKSSKRGWIFGSGEV